MGNGKGLKFKIQNIIIHRKYDTEMGNKITLDNSEKRKKELKINRSTFWYQQRKIKEGKTLKVYNKTKVRIE